MPVSSAEVVTSQHPPEVGDKVSWRTGTGFRTGGTVLSVRDGVARVRTLTGAHDSFGVVTIGVAKLAKENPL